MVGTETAGKLKGARQSRAASPEMLDALKQIAAEHYVASPDEQTRPTFSETDTLAQLQHLEATWAVASPEQLAKERERSEALLESIRARLSQHFAREEEVLLPILSSTLARALEMAHNRLRSSLAEIQAATAGVMGKGQVQSELLAARARVQSLLRELNRFLKEHVAEEHVIFELATMAYEKKRGRA